MMEGHAGGGRTAAELPSALASWHEIAARLDAKRPAMFLDYDGTLTPIVAQPEDAVLSDEMREVLEELARLCTVAIVSGRDRGDVEPLVDVEGLVYAGSHGFDIRGPNLRMEHEGGRACLPELARAEQELESRLDPIPGARVERKRFAIANHYRNVADDDVPHVERAVREVLAMHEEALRISGGKKVFELRPNIEWDKGKAVLWLLEALGLDGDNVVPFYVGDDVTDEDAFRALEGEGVGILVGLPDYPTYATYGLRDTEEAREFMLGMINLLRNRGS